MTRRRADQQARRVPWQRLLEARTEYADWQVFNFWVRSIVEAEGAIPDWVRDVVENRCPGFFDYERHYREIHPRKKHFLWQRLWEWINNTVFGEAQREGWLNAITFYALRDGRFQRVFAYWNQCHNKWRLGKPVPYPSFEEWRRAADQYIEKG